MKIIKDVEYLRTISRDVIDFNDALRAFAQDMMKVMKREKGVGLAAIQVGKPLRFFVMQPRMGSTIVCYNPEILSKEKRMKGKEGCLSFPGLMVRKTRHKRILVKYQDGNGVEVKKNFSNLEAVIFQHELDHLNGITIMDDTK